MKKTSIANVISSRKKFIRKSQVNFISKYIVNLKRTYKISVLLKATLTTNQTLYFIINEKWSSFIKTFKNKKKK